LKEEKLDVSFLLNFMQRYKDFKNKTFLYLLF